jgi:hypothetical protein
MVAWQQYRLQLAAERPIAIDPATARSAASVLKTATEE